MDFKKIMPLAVVGVLSAATTVGTLHYFDSKYDNNNKDFNYFHSSRKDAQFASLNNAAALGDDFVKASKTAVPAVVTIKNYQINAGRSRGMDQDLFEFFFGNPFGDSQRPRQTPKDMPSGLGSGVIISPDGYIITNNHVVANASKLEVVLSNKKTYIATLVGTDPSTDIALLKIEDKGLPYLNFANSNLVEVGQWVLAIGNPLGLNSTVTAGIISAKGRSIDLLSQQSKTPIESFIQTDAVINRGNSGGALINIHGDLIGINSAISSSTGYYEGYGFAVPSNLARKVVEDIKKFGLVQRGFLGVSNLDLSNEMLIRQYNQQYKTNIKPGSGVYVTNVADHSGALDAGIRKGDIITKIDGQNINNFADLSLAIGSKRPGDSVKVTYIRNGRETTTTVTLKDQQGNTKFRSKADLSVSEKLGADFQTLTDRDKVYFGIDSGVGVINVSESGLLASIGISEQNIITEINGKPINSKKDVERILKGYKGQVNVKYLDDNGRLTSRGFKMP
ncbi:Do family serine endopeptidase [Elizabethkingia argentiflava]|uniref:Do family serine endopeptidase n=1 Tax=Elizabethkingia argenteiflava TaxID=2681556 RepID=A0A845PYR3_9FLAO|nr:Do family serine endopeptidase [Elizabethkingia argenteiflava]NAW52051.1 Do family serine endopeptidase [Elizabethkingia argenteiflava]